MAHPTELSSSKPIPGAKTTSDTSTPCYRPSPTGATCASAISRSFSCTYPRRFRRCSPCSICGGTWRSAPVCPASTSSACTATDRIGKLASMVSTRRPRRACRPTRLRICCLAASRPELFWTEAFWPAIGGVEVLTSKLLPALCARGHEILLVTDDDLGKLPAHDEFRSIPIRRLGMRTALLSRSAIKIAAMKAAAVALQREFSPQLVHINCLGATAFFLRRSSTLPARPTLLTLHSEWPISPSPQPKLVTKVLADATWVTAVCQAVLAKASQQVPEITSRSSIIYNAVTEPDEPLQPLPFDPPRVVCVGRLAPEKGLDRAIDAFARITSRHPGLRLVICGDGAAPTGADSLREIVARSSST